MRKVLFIFLCVFLSLVTFLSLLFLPKKAEQEDIDRVESLEIWHIDMIEGGIGSRTTFLKKVAKKFSEITGIVVRVTLQTPTSVAENLKNNHFPDLISYSAGLDLPYDKIAKINGDSYAECWCKGGYLLISRKNQEIKGVLISEQEYTLGLLAYYMAEINIPIINQANSAEAIYYFYNNKNCALLGTQRDLFRLQNKGYDLQVKALSRFNDIKQYISIISSGNNYNSSKNFINYLLSYTNEKGALESIGMLTANGYNDSCNLVLDIFNGITEEYTTYALFSKEQLENIKNMCKNYQTNAKSIKNMLKRLI